MPRYFGVPFGLAASKATIPEDDSVKVSWKNGYSIYYEYNTLTNKDARHIERDVFNTLLYEITSTIKELQLTGISQHYDEIIKGEGYRLGALVYYSGKLWRSKIENNKIIPNETKTANWDIVYPYTELVAKLTKDGYLSSGGGSSSGYTKTEIDKKFTSMNNSLIEAMTDYYYKELGEIYLLTWCDKDRNADGFFLCNGDRLPYTTDGKYNKTDLTYYGNQLYALCYNDNKTETEFKKRWNINIDTKTKTIQLPNILGLATTGELTSEVQTINLEMGKTSTLPVVTTSPHFFDLQGKDSDAKVAKKLVHSFKMLPCVYLGTIPE